MRKNGAFLIANPHDIFLHVCYREILNNLVKNIKIQNG